MPRVPINWFAIFIHLVFCATLTSVYQSSAIGGLLGVRASDTENVRSGQGIYLALSNNVSGNIHVMFYNIHSIHFNYASNVG